MARHVLPMPMVHRDANFPSSRGAASLCPIAAPCRDARGGAETRGRFTSWLSLLAEVVGKHADRQFDKEGAANCESKGRLHVWQKVLTQIS